MAYKSAIKHYNNAHTNEQMTTGEAVNILKDVFYQYDEYLLPDIPELSGADKDIRFRMWLINLMETRVILPNPFVLAVAGVKTPEETYGKIMSSIFRS